MTGAELSISASVAGSFRVTPPLSNPVMEQKQETVSKRNTGGLVEELWRRKTGGRIELSGRPVVFPDHGDANGCSVDDGSRAHRRDSAVTQEQGPE